MSLLRGGGNDLTESQTNLFTHLRYNPNTRRVESDVPLSTTLNSFYLEEQFQISAGGAAIFFKNLDKQITYFTDAGYLLNQDNPANQGRSGFSNSVTRRYSDNLVTVGIRGPINTTGVITDYATVSVSPSNISVWGTRFRLGQDLTVGMEIIYSLYSGVDDTGIRVFHQKVEIDANNAAITDDFFQIWWDHPAEILTGDSIYAEIIVREAGESDIPLRVWATAAADDQHWFEANYRTFTSEFVATEESVNRAIGDVEFGIAERIGVDTIHTRDGETIYWLDGEEILWDDIVRLPKVNISRHNVRNAQHWNQANFPLIITTGINWEDEIEGGSTIDHQGQGFSLLAGVEYKLTCQMLVRQGNSGQAEITLEWRDVLNSNDTIEGIPVLHTVTNHQIPVLLSSRTTYRPDVDTELQLYVTRSGGNGVWLMGGQGYASWIQIEFDN